MSATKLEPNTTPTSIEQAAAAQSLLDSTPQSLFAVDRAYRYTAFNQAHFRRMEAVYGVQIQRGHNLLDYLPTAEDRARIQGNIDRALGGEAFSEVGVIAGGGGTRRWIEVHHAPEPDGQGGVSGVSCRSEDVTELWRTRDDLHSMDSLFQTAFMQAAVGVAQLSPEGVFLRANPGLCALLGYSEAELVGRKFEEITVPEDRAVGAVIVVEGLRQPGLQPEPQTWRADLSRCERRCLRKDGIAVWVDFSSTANRGQDGEIQYHIAYIQDISAAKAAQSELLDHRTRLDELVWERTQQLTASEMFSRSLFENTESIIVILDPVSRKILDLNPAACVFFELPYEQLLQMRRSDLFEIPTEDLRNYTEKIIRGEKVYFETVLRKAGGESRHMGICVDQVQYKQSQALMVVLHDITVYKQAELAAQDGERRLREIIDLIPEFIWSADANGEVDFINQKTLTYLGLTLGQAMKRGWEQAVHPDDEAELERKWEAAARVGSFMEIELRLRRYDGEYRWFLLRAQPVRGGAGRVGKWYGVVVDITYRKQAEAETAFHTSLLEQVDNGVVAITFDNTVIYWNKFAEEMYQWSRDEAIGKNLLELLEPEEIKEPDQESAPHAPRGRKWSAGSYTVRRKDGSTIQVDIDNSHLRAAGGGITGFIPISHDITERRRAEEQVQTSIRQMKQLTAQAPGMLFQFLRRPDGSYCLPYSSDALHTIFQVAPETVVDDFTPIEQKIEVEDRAWFLEKVEESARSLTPFDSEVRLRLNADEVRWVWVSARPEGLDDGGVLWSGFCADITERKQLEEQARLNEEKWRGVFDLLPVGVAVVDEKNNISDSNQAFAQIMGLTIEQLQSGFYQKRKFLFPDLSPMTAKESPSARSLREQTPVRDVEIGMVKEDGAVVWTSVSAAPLPSGKGAATVMVDISAQKELEANLRERVQELTCLHEVSRLVESQAIAEASLCQQLVESLARAVRFAGEGAVELVVDGRRYTGGEAAQGHLNERTAVVTAHGVERGRLGIYNPADCPYPQPSKQALLEDLAAVLGFWLENKEAKEEVRKLITAIEQSPVSIMIADPSGTIEYVNSSFCRMTGYSVEEAVGKNPRFLQSGYTSPEQYRDLWKTIRLGRIWHGEFRNRKKNGEFYWENASISPILGEDGGITHLLAVKEDVSERKHDQQRIEEGLAFNQTILDASPMGILIYNAAGDCISANQAAGAITGTDLANLLRQNIHTIDSWKKSGLYAAAVQALESQQAVVTQVHLVSTFGKEMWLNARFVAFKAGGETNLLLMFEDDSERQSAQANLQISNEKLIVMVADLETRNKNADLLRQMSDMLAVSATVEEAQAVVDQFAPKIFQDSRGAVYMAGQAPRSMLAISTWGQGLSSEVVFARDACWALRRGQAYTFRADEAGIRCRHVARDFGGSYLDVPLTAGGEIMGLLHLEWELLEGGQRGMRELTQLFADNISLSFANIRLRETLHEQSVRDPLTRAFNRRYMEETLDRELPRARRKNGHTALIMLDIDHFKKFNDSYGHAGGDLILTRLSRMLQSNVRGEDVVCRLGGEEFLMILPDADGAVAVQRAEGIRAGVEAMNIAYENGYLGTVTVSIGVAVFPQSGSTRDVLIHKADQALYLAKKNGRNRVELFVEPDGSKRGEVNGHP